MALKKGGGNRIIYILALLAAVGAVFILVSKMLMTESAVASFTQPMKRGYRRAPRGSRYVREGIDKVLEEKAPEEAVAAQSQTPFDDYDMLGSWQSQFKNDLRNNATGVPSGIAPATAGEFAPYSLNLEQNIPDPYINNMPINELVESKANRELSLESTDLLPQETNDEWYQNDFGKARYRIGGNNLINTDQYHIGVDTQGSSLKIANYDLRPRPPNPKIVISPWNNSSVEPDLNNKGGLDGL